MNIEFNKVIKLESYSSGGDISVSIPDGSDVIIGQDCYLTIEVKADENVIKNINNISIEGDDSSIIVTKINPWIVKDKNCGKAFFLLQINKQLSPETQINYTVHAFSISQKDVDGITPKGITYTVKKIEETSIITLESDNNFLELPTKPNPVGDHNSEFSIYSGIVTDYRNAPLKNVQVTISSSITGKLISPLVYIATDSEPSDIITIDTPDDSEFFTVNSDEHGNIRFRVYPIKDKSARIDFQTQIMGVTDVSYAASIYVFKSISNFPFGLSPPNIIGKNSDNTLEKTSGKTEFNVGVNPYPGYSSTDTLIFFTKSEISNEIKQVKPVYRLNDITDLYSHQFCFLYSELKLNEFLGFYYMVAPMNGEPRYSDKSKVKYIIGQGGSPNENNKNVYNKVKIYSSYAAPPLSDPSNKESEVYEHDTVTLDMIEQKKKGGSVYVKDAIGLYILIQSTNDPQKHTLPKIGQSGGVKLQFTSRTRNKKKTYPFKILDSNGAIVTIPYCDLIRAARYRESGIPGSLHFEYYTDEDDGTKIYSKLWLGGISTAYNHEDIDNQGCPPDDDD
ncbi:hypothetical protein [Xenorhabdus hominickii]|uniref:Uncharacterized protein n=1 Tax=Xenorhabdus hominickii TaxID=351679 RepID=A0A2G0QFC6_XENHO|nr:hypothetical protein [Xenorhabdus hominickii]AOM41933.1 hypothetical protein A9255_16035 [Xenorhabdus hominickii]PHM57914.1 hypothetical protein Xhom_00917 [Xenorhabdus hominickii]